MYCITLVDGRRVAKPLRVSVEQVQRTLPSRDDLRAIYEATKVAQDRVCILG